MRRPDRVKTLKVSFAIKRIFQAGFLRKISTWFAGKTFRVCIVWGIDYDNLRGWHEHPVGQTELRIILEAQTISSIIKRLQDAISGAASPSV